MTASFSDGDFKLHAGSFHAMRAVCFKEMISKEFSAGRGLPRPVMSVSTGNNQLRRNTGSVLFDRVSACENQFRSQQFAMSGGSVVSSRCPPASLACTHLPTNASSSLSRKPLPTPSWVQIMVQSPREPPAGASADRATVANPSISVAASIFMGMRRGRRFRIDGTGEKVYYQVVVAASGRHGRRMTELCRDKYFEIQIHCGIQRNREIFAYPAFCID
jgi:hypothetical protein